MPAKGKPVARECDGLSKVVRLQAEHREDSSSPKSEQQDRRKHVLAALRVRPLSKAGRAQVAITRLGLATIGDVHKALEDEGFPVSAQEARKCVNSLARRRVIVQTGRREGVVGREGIIWAVDLDANLVPTPPGAVEQLGVDLKGRIVRLAIYRPRLSDGVMRPSTDALRLNVDCLPALIVALQGAEAQGRATGLIGSHA